MVRNHRKYRDLSLEPISVTETLVIACDVSASIGLKPHDFLQVDPYITARYAMRVPLLELLAVNAQPFLVMSLCSNEWEDTGKQFYRGIKDELEQAGFSHLPVSGSTEENMETSMSSIGITLIGRGHYSQLLMNKVQAGDICYQCGYPYVGAEMLEHQEELPTYEDIAYLHSLQSVVNEMVPIGSKGSLNEAQQVAEVNGCQFIVKESDKCNTIGKLSAGPATSLLVVGQEELLPHLQQRFDFVMEVGHMQ